MELIQVAGDEAGGLTSAVTNLLGINKSSDLFHIQQEGLAKFERNRFLGDLADLRHWTQIHILLRVGNLRQMAKVGESTKKRSARILQVPQQDITKGLTGPLARQVGRAKKSLDKCHEEKEKSLQAFRQKLEKPGSTIEDVNVVKSGKKALNAVAQEETCLKELEKAKNEQEMAQEAGRVIYVEK